MDHQGDEIGSKRDSTSSFNRHFLATRGPVVYGVPCSTMPRNKRINTGLRWFMYMEASHPRVANDTAVLRSAVYPASGTRCLHFYYHMYGKSMGNLRVTYRLIGSSSDNEVWTKKGDQGNSWKLAKVNLPPSKSGLQIAFVGRRGSSYTGDAAIDDVFFTDGPC